MGFCPSLQVLSQLLLLDHWPHWSIRSIRIHILEQEDFSLSTVAGGVQMQALSTEGPESAMAYTEPTWKQRKLGSDRNLRPWWLREAWLLFCLKSFPLLLSAPAFHSGSGWAKMGWLLLLTAQRPLSNAKDCKKGERRVCHWTKNEKENRNPSVAG